MKFLNELICRLRGHRRGRRVSEVNPATGMVTLQCPRCDATWPRKPRQVSKEENA